MDKINNQTLLSIVVPSFNQGRFINDNLRVYSNFSKDSLEVIVIDALSSDNTDEFIQYNRESLSVIISEKDNGQADALNKGLNLSTSKWFAFQNSDDYYDIKGLSEILSFLDREGDSYDIVVAGTNFVDEDGIVIKENIPRPIFLLPLVSMNFINNQSFFKRLKM